MTRKPIRVLYVLNSSRGGASLGIYEMLRRLPRNRYEAYAVSPPDASTNDENRMREIFDGVRFVQIPWWDLSTELGWARRAAIAAANLRRGITIKSATGEIVRAIQDWQIDIVHTTTSLTLSGALAAQKTGARHIWHIKECIGSAGRVKFPFSDSELVRYMSNLSDRIVAMSNCVAAPFHASGCAKIDLLADGVDVTPYLECDSRDLRARLNLGDSEKLVGMVASLSSSWKRHDVFVRMVGRLAVAL
jgi:hypothetical protein